MSLSKILKNQRNEYTFGGKSRNSLSLNAEKPMITNGPIKKMYTSRIERINTKPLLFIRLDSYELPMIR